MKKDVCLTGIRLFFDKNIDKDNMLLYNRRIKQKTE